MALREELQKQGSWLFRWRSYLPLLILPVLLIALRDSEYAPGEFYKYLCIAVSFSGLVVRSITIGYVPSGTSGRNTKKQIAETLNTRGVYSIVRHPLYFGNFIIFLGITLFVQVWWFTLIAVLGFWLYYERIMFAEEEFLRKKFGNLYLKWAEKTPAFHPKFKNWQQPDLPFSFKKVLKKEYSGFFAIIITFTFLEIVGNIFIEKRMKLDFKWKVFFIVGIVIYLTLRVLKKRTKLLNVEDR